MTAKPEPAIRLIPRRGLSQTLIAVLFFISASYVHAAETPDSVVSAFDARYSVKLDWIKGELRISINAPLDVLDKRNQAGLVGRKEHQIRSLFPSLFPLALQDLRVNSTTYLGDLLHADEDLAFNFQNEIANARLLRSQPSRDLKSLSLEYSFLLFPNIAEQLVHFERPLPIPALLDWKPSAAFTGLVIYAKDELPVHGTQERTRIVPSLFPRIFDQDTRLIVSMERTQAPILTASGLVRFTTSVTPDAEIKARVGTNPMMIAARGLFGTTATDPIISREDADILLGNPDTRKALSEGRIAIILPDDRAVEILTE